MIAKTERAEKEGMKETKSTGNSSAVVTPQCWDCGNAHGGAWQLQGIRWLFVVDKFGSSMIILCKEEAAPKQAEQEA